MDLEDRNRLFGTLAHLTPAQFEQLMFSINPPVGIISGGKAPQGNRVAELLAWIEGPSSTQTLEQLDRILAEFLKHPQRPLQ